VLLFGRISGLAVVGGCARTGERGGNTQYPMWLAIVWFLKECSWPAEGKPSVSNYRALSANIMNRWFRPRRFCRPFTAWPSGQVPMPTYLSEAFRVSEEDRLYVKSPAAREAVQTICNDLNDSARGRRVGRLDGWAYPSWDTYFRENLSKDGDANDASFRHLTSVLGYPLTLAYSLAQISETYIGRRITIACVGARAEASIPTVLWREAAMALGVEKLTIIMVGPMTPDLPLVETDVLDLRFRSGLYDPKDDSDMGTPDALVFFNSGCSDLQWRSVWRPTLLSCIETNVPMIFSCYDAIDLARDYGYTCGGWQDEVGKSKHLHLMPKVILEPQLNPFSNLMPGIYDTHENRVIHTNQYIFAVQKR